MTIYFKESDWNKLKDKLHQLQLISEEINPNSPESILIEECLDILQQQDCDEVQDEIIHDKKHTKTTKSKRQKVDNNSYVSFIV